jgi:serine/threonine protein kinase/tetratricopeptide (TPR) repeat protein
VTSPVSTDSLIGTTVSQYEILSKLGGGGMGVVYKARDTKLGRLVALKFLPPQWSHDDSAKQRFVREAQAASATNQRNICVIHNIEEMRDSRLFIVMAYYEGETLKQRLERGPLPINEAVEIASEIADGLAKAHAQGVIHRDVKPGNLIVTDDGVKILDFGLAKFADALQLTVPGSTIGTIAYMSPEQARGEEADARSDVWALGIVMYEMLTGAVPFRGTYQEATFHAIKNEPLPSLRAARPDVPEALERLVMKALEKDPEKRFQSAREPARELKLLLGRTVPLELLTIEVPRPAGVDPASLPRQTQPRRRTSSLRLALIATLLIATVSGIYFWIQRPIERIPIVVAPLINQTGYAELDQYRLALTELLANQLRASPYVRVLSHDRSHEITRSFLTSGADPSSREALQALATSGGVNFVVVPTLSYEDRSWRAKVEIRSAETATNIAAYQGDSIVSSLPKEVAYDLLPLLIQRVETHFQRAAPRSRRLVDFVKAPFEHASETPTRTFHTLDAAADFEEGLRAYDDFTYAESARSFAAATEKDPQSALAYAWLGHANQILQKDDLARQAADKASQLVTPSIPPAEATFVAAVKAESARDYATAQAHYRELAARQPDDPSWLMELGAFQYRRGSWSDGVTTYRSALSLDERYVRPHLELCRLYNRLNEFAKAKEEGEAALKAYQALNDASGEAQARMCLTDMLRVGTDEQRMDGKKNAERAVDILRGLNDEYNLARAHYYVALAAESLGRPFDAIDAYQRSLTFARPSGNSPLEPLVLMNIGAIYLRVGDYAQALRDYQQSQKLFEDSGDQGRAAQDLANVAAILIEFGGRAETGVRDLENARAVFERNNDKNWELFAAKVMAAAHRYAGRHTDAERELNRAVTLARGWEMSRETPWLTIDLALSRLELSDYPKATDLLTQALGDGSGRDAPYAIVVLAVTETRLGQLEAARASLESALTAINARGALDLLPELHEAWGEYGLAAGRLAEAREHFSSGAALWKTELVNPASVAARANLALLDVQEGRNEGRTAAEASLAKARQIGAQSVIARCRICLARIHLKERRFTDALQLTTTTTSDDVLGPELLAELHHWHGEALKLTGDAQKAGAESVLARQLVDRVATSLPLTLRSGFMSRPDIRNLAE